MNHKSSAPHLRLVDASRTVIAPVTKQTTEQLAFPYPEAATIFFALVDVISPSDFSEILKEGVPRWIIDVRVAPRLDTLAGSRMIAFNLFERLNASYVDLFGRLRVKSYSSAEANPAFWMDSALDIFESSRQQGPYLFLFDNDEMLRATEAIMLRAMSSLGTKNHFAPIQHLGVK